MCADPLEPVRGFLSGHSLRELADVSGVPYKTIHNWLKRGTPLALTQGLRVIAAVSKATKGGRQRKPKESPGTAAEGKE